MKTRNNVVLLFSKLPEVGLVKTRLTTLKDGYLSPEQACELYQCMLLDVVDIVNAAFDVLECKNDAACGEADLSHDTMDDVVRDTYTLVVSTAPAQNAHAMRKLLEQVDCPTRPLEVIVDSGASFDEHYNDAFSQVWEKGADCIFSFGADMPALTVDDVVRGFEALHKLDDMDTPGIVVVPDQELGVSAIGWTRTTDFDHTGVFYNQSGLTVLPAYIQKARRLGLAALYLPPIPDVDTMADLYHNITLAEALNYCAPYDGNTPPRRTWEALCAMGYGSVVIAPNNLLDPRDYIDL